MRSLPFLAAAVLVALPASAQAIQCEGSAYDEKVGDVAATYDLDKTGQVKGQSISFVPERVEGVGQESDFFARPRILLEYRVNDAGDLIGPNVANVLVTRFQDAGRKPPPLSAVQIKVTAPSIEPLSWNGADTLTGERKLAAMMRDQKPVKVKVDIVAKDSKILASADFDLSGTAQFQKLVALARAEGQKRVAAFQKLAAEGGAPKTCPAG